MPLTAALVYIGVLASDFEWYSVPGGRHSAMTLRHLSNHVKASEDS